MTTTTTDETTTDAPMIDRPMYITLGTTTIVVTRELGMLAGFSVYDSGVGRGVTGEDRDPGRYATKRLAQALSEGFDGEKAILRAVALAEADRRANEVCSHEAKVATLARETAQLQEKAAAISGELIKPR